MRRPWARDTAERLHVARAELVLALADAQPLRHLPLEPDPLTGFARAMEAVHSDLGESASVVVDLLPVSPAERVRHRKRLLAAVADQGAGQGADRRAGVGDQVRVGLGHRQRLRDRGRTASSAGLQAQVDRSSGR